MKTTPSVSRRWWLLLPIVIAVALPLWQTSFRYGWLEMALGSLAWLFWIAVFAWAVLTVAAIRRYRAWWLLITAPFVLYPIVMAVGLLAACAGGDCL
jgi:hypothetical protein